MAIPQNIINEFAFIQGQIDRAIPLTTASQPMLLAIQLNTMQLVSDCENAQTKLAGQLDTWTPPPTNEPTVIISGILDLSSSAQDEANIVLLRGLAGRMATNLNQLG